MKIKLISDEYPPVLGGAGIVAKQLVKSAIKAGHFINVFCPAIERNKLFKFFWPISYLSFSLLKNIKDSDHVLVNDVRSAYFIGLLSFLRIVDLNNVIYILHGTEYSVAYDCNNKNRILRFAFIYNLFLSRVRKIVAVSNYTKKVFLEKTTCKVDINEKIITLYAGVDSDFLSFNKVDPFVEKSTFDLVSVSRIEERKGFFEMLSIFKNISDKRENIRWHIYGNGKILSQLKDLVVKNNLSDKVIFKSEIEREKIYNKDFPIYNYDLFWLLPNKPEAFGLVYIEAAIVGVPTLGINKYGIKESVCDLFYKDPEDLLSLIGKIEKNKSYYSQSSCIFAKKFLSDNFYNELIK